MSLSIDLGFSAEGLEEARTLVEGWLAEGMAVDSGAAPSFEDAGEPALEVVEHDGTWMARGGRTDQLQDGWSRVTRVWLARDGDCAEVSVRAAHYRGAVTPPGCKEPLFSVPTFVGELIDAVGIEHEGRPLGGRILYCQPERVDAFLDFLRDGSRRWPVVVAADRRQAEYLQPAVQGLAHVVLIEGTALNALKAQVGWELSPTRSWIRVLWPGLVDRVTHDWIRVRSDEPSAEQLARIACETADEIARRSASGTATPAIDRRIDAALRDRRLEAEREASRARNEELKRQIAELQAAARSGSTAAADDVALAELFAEFDAKEQERNALLARIAELETDVDNERARREEAERQLRSRGTSPAQLPSLVEPQTPLEAVELARESTDGALVFGADVENTARELAPKAGPPKKIFDALEALADMARARAEGPLGTSMVHWMRDRNFDVSGEDDGVKGNAKQVAKRTWHDGESRTFFEMHVKVNESTSHDQCVRIYYRWDDDAKVVRIGSVGRHP